MKKLIALLTLCAAPMMAQVNGSGGTYINGKPVFDLGAIYLGTSLLPLANITPGTDTQVLTMSGTTVTWGAASGGGLSGLTATRVPFALNATSIEDDSGLTYVKATDTLSVVGGIVTPAITPATDATFRLFTSGAAGVMAGTTTTVGSATGCSSTATSAVITCTAHGLTLLPGDFALITAATTAGDKGNYSLISQGSPTPGASITLSRALAGTQSDVAVTFYRQGLWSGPLRTMVSGPVVVNSYQSGSADGVGLDVHYTPNLSGSANDTGVRIVKDADTASPGTSYLISGWGGTGGGTREFSVTDAGVGYFAGTVTATEYKGTSFGPATAAATAIGSSSASTGNLSWVSINPQIRGTGSSNGLYVNSYIGNNTANMDGTYISVYINDIWNMATASSEGPSTDLLINRTETNLSTGAQNLIDAQVATVSKFTVDNKGNVWGQATGQWYTLDATTQVGAIVCIDESQATCTGDCVSPCGGSSEKPIGVYVGTQAGTAHASTLYLIATTGKAYIIPEEDHADTALGDVCVTSATAGYGAFSATVPATHNQEIGHAVRASAKVTFNGVDDVDPTANTIALDSDPTTWAVDDPVVFWNSGDTAPTGMTDGTVYWIKTKAGEVVTLSASKAGAVLDITGDGSGTTMYLQKLVWTNLHWN